jgi:hypothetical protein
MKNPIKPITKANITLIISNLNKSGQNIRKPTTAIIPATNDVIRGIYSYFRRYNLQIIIGIRKYALTIMINNTKESIFLIKKLSDITLLLCFNSGSTYNISIVLSQFHSVQSRVTLRKMSDNTKHIKSFEIKTPLGLIIIPCGFPRRWHMYFASSFQPQ